jgi:hypothetical protein
MVAEVVEEVVVIDIGGYGGRGDRGAGSGRGQGGCGGRCGSGVGQEKVANPIYVPGGRSKLKNLITIQAMHDGIVKKSVFRRYTLVLIHFATWIHLEHVDWMTDYGKTKFDELALERDEGRQTGYTKESQRRLDCDVA